MALREARLKLNDGVRQLLIGRVGEFCRDEGRVLPLRAAGSVASHREHRRNMLFKLVDDGAVSLFAVVGLIGKSEPALIQIGRVDG